MTINPKHYQLHKRGRDPVFKCSICGRFIAYADIDTDKVRSRLGNTIDTAMETVEYWHSACEKNMMREFHERVRSDHGKKM